MTIRIRSIDIASHKLDDTAPPSYGSIAVEMGGIDFRLMLKQEQIDAMVAAAEPIAAAAVQEIASMRIVAA